jgi:peptidoglycan/xylan/chitin deacetylase (PgdA/CDA1 family)
LPNQAALAVAGLLPRSARDRPERHAVAGGGARAEIALTFDDGLIPRLRRVLDQLDEAGMTATFFLIGERAALHPALVREIVRRGHAVENHSHRHSTAFAFYGLGRMRRDVEAAQAAIADAAGVAPVFFRAPFGIRSPLLDPALARCGLDYVSWTRRGFDTVARDPARVLERLARGAAAGDIYLLHDGIAARARTGEAHALAVLPALGARLAALGLRSVTLRVPLAWAMTAPERAALDAIVAAAGSAYAPAGRTPLHFARGKLRHDPVFRAIIARGLIPDGTRLVDLGCGQGVLPAFLFAARGCYERGEWPTAWPPPPRLASVLGVDLRHRAIAAARAALRERATVRVGNVRDAEIPQCEVITILDAGTTCRPDDQARACMRAAAPAAGGTPAAAGRRRRCRCARRSRAFRPGDHPAPRRLAAASHARAESVIAACRAGELASRPRR